MYNHPSDRTPSDGATDSSAGGATTAASGGFWWSSSTPKTAKELKKTAKVFDCARSESLMRRLCPCTAMEQPSRSGGGGALVESEGVREGASGGGGRVRYWYDEEGRASVEVF